jgi:hydroxymethylbilane synthase
MSEPTIVVATRGSALALAQTRGVVEQCRTAFPDLAFEVRIIKTTGDKLQTDALTAGHLPKGLFTKELEVALLDEEADFAVHSLKDLPTDLPDGLTLGAVSPRADVRDVMVYREAGTSTESAGRRNFPPGLTVAGLPADAVAATSSPRRSAQLVERHPGLRVVPIRGNVTTRLRKLAQQGDFDLTLLAAAGLHRLGFEIHSSGALRGPGVPDGLLAAPLSTDEMLPAVGQAALGIEMREDDERIARLAAMLDDFPSHQCAIAERAFLKGMGGGCQIPVGALAEIVGGELRLRAVSFLGEEVRRGSVNGPIGHALELGARLASQLRA